jgi:CysZ protein
VLRWIHPGDFLRGVLYPLRGLAILRRHPGLSRYWLPPLVLTMIALIASIVLAFRYHDDAVQLVWQAPLGQAWSEQILKGLHWLLRLLALVVGIGLGMLVCIAFANLLAAPFNDALSEVVEELETGEKSRPFSLARLARDLGRTLRIELLKVAVYVGVMLPLLLLSWVLPGIGQALYLVFASAFTVLYLAFDYVDWPASRRGLRFSERLALLRVRPLMTIGFGCAVFACLFVPLLNLLFMPLAVAGGTRLFLDLESYAQQER